MLTAIVLFLFLLTTGFDCMTILQHEGKKGKVIYFSIMLISFCVLVLYSLDISVPSPSTAITSAFEAIFRLAG
jgi:hypothetical protein